MVPIAVRIVRGRPLLAFFVLSFAISWALWAPLIVFGRIMLEIGVGVALLITGVFGPTFAALLVAFAAEGQEGVHRLLARALAWRVAPRWYVIAALGPVVLMLVAIGLSGEMARAQLGNLFLLVPLFFAVFFFGPLEQELGWRGYALPRLQERHSALVAALLSGLLWGVWHVPLFWTPGTPQQMSAQDNPLPLALIATTVLYDTSLTVLFTWLFNRSGGSIPTAFVFHTSIDTAILTPMVLGLTNVPLSGDSPIFLLFLGLVLVWVVLVVRTLGPPRAVYSPSRDLRPHSTQQRPQRAHWPARRDAK